jgi:hypothetical protein
MTRRSVFSLSAITRALKGAQAAGLSVSRYEIGADGKLVIYTGDEPPDDISANPWDEVLRNGAEKRSP